MLKRSNIIPAVVLDLVKQMNGSDPLNIRDNYRNRLDDIRAFIQEEVEKYDMMNVRRK